MPFSWEIVDATPGMIALWRKPVYGGCIRLSEGAIFRL
jgi:hypothetical protein